VSSKPTPAPTHSKASGCAANGRNASLTIVNESVTWQFSPRTVSVTCGTTVTVTNKSNTDHTWTGGSWDSGNLSAGTGRYSYVFRSPGTFSFVCFYHATMTGKVVVSAP
jgi:plastocyanin